MGRIIGMGDERIPKKVLYGRFHNKRPVGKPRTRWEDVVRRDTSHILEIRGLRRRAEDKEEWRRLLRGGPGPRRGCSVIDGWMDGWRQGGKMGVMWYGVNNKLEEIFNMETRRVYMTG